MSEQKKDVISFKEPVQIKEIEKTFAISGIQCADPNVARRMVAHVAHQVRKHEVITPRKIREIFMRCI